MSLWQRSLQQLQLILRLNSLRNFVSLFLVGMFLSVAVAACSGGNQTLENGKPKNVEFTLVSFIVTRDAYKAIIPKFIEKWQQEHNQNVTISQSYGASGSQTRAVIDGLPADVVHLALGLDTERIEKAGLIKPGWQREFPNNGIVSQSVAALVTRAGNPKNINTWADLQKDGIRMVTADPKTSGVARWNFVALWNSAMINNQDEGEATEFVRKIYKNVPALTKDAREATDAFLKQGQGDALINYENEIILAQQKGLKVNYTIPDVNISIDNPIAIVDQNVDKHRNREVVAGFVQYLFSSEAQVEFAKVGFRPVNKEVYQTQEFIKKYPQVKTLAKIQDLGGWDVVQKKFFADGGIFDQIQSRNR
ncbi:sulfate ABC transporter substrate-binding protein [Okeanomitos corallinicola TIOX110]|uniref:Sulfate ABC transporter substrate-binding protein n=1 Tax=Okeanomitos corallinicola TIOX110 TaxID=3133117 RepID=A0ABZ2UN72_9CYAN